MDSISRERSELIALFREGVLSKEELREQLATLAIQIRHLDATPQSRKPPAALVQDEKHDAAGLTNAEFDEVMGDWLAEDEEHKDAPLEQKDAHSSPKPQRAPLVSTTPSSSSSYSRFAPMARFVLPSVEP